MKYIFLGYMGAGKTTLGAAFAAAKKIPFVDLDALLERELGGSIAEFMEQKGELAFRKKEHEVLMEWVKSSPEASVVALGGGTPVFYNHMETLNEVGETVYLDVSVAELAKRLEEDTDRPLLKNQDDKMEFIAKHLFERRPFYFQAKHRIQGDQLTVEDALALFDGSKP
ncbi:MAG: shikimate kinase [Schleiferiaceae bacterium]